MSGFHVSPFDVGPHMHRDHSAAAISPIMQKIDGPAREGDGDDDDGDDEDDDDGDADDDDDGDDDDDEDGDGDVEGDDDGNGDHAESPIQVHSKFSQKLNKEKGVLTASFSD